MKTEPSIRHDVTPFGFTIVDKDGEWRWSGSSTHLGRSSIDNCLRFFEEGDESRGPHRIVELYTKEQLEKARLEAISHERQRLCAEAFRASQRGESFDFNLSVNGVESSLDEKDNSTVHLNTDGFVGYGPVINSKLDIRDSKNGDADIEVKLSRPTIDKFTHLVKALAKNSKSRGES